MQPPPEILASYCVDRAPFLARYLSRYCKKDFLPQQLDVLTTLSARNSKRNPLHNKVLIIMPRGARKSTTVGAYVAANACLRLSNFCMYFSTSESIAVSKTEIIKNMIRVPDIQEDFGTIGISQETERGKTDKDFAKTAWVARFPDPDPNYIGMKILPRGAGQATSGWTHEEFRPDLLVFDDLEKRGMSIDQTEALYEWLLSAALPTVEQDEQEPEDCNYQIIYIDTMKGQSCIPYRLSKDPSWTVIDAPLCDEDYHSLMPSWKSDRAVHEMVEQFRAKGKIAVFCREYMNLPIPTEGGNFDAKYFKEIPEGIHPNSKSIENVIICDPAKSSEQSDEIDDYGIIAAGIDTRSNAIYVWEAIGEHLTPEQFYDRSWRLANKYQTRVIGCEVTGLKEFISFPFKNFLKTKGGFYEFIELSARGRKKEDRIFSLSPFYEGGYIYHRRALCAKLENQLLAHPNSKHDDVADALAYIVEMLDKGGRFFSARQRGIDDQMIDDDAEEQRLLKELDAEESEMYDFAEI